MDAEVQEDAEGTEKEDEGGRDSGARGIYYRRLSRRPRMRMAEVEKDMEEETTVLVSIVFSYSFICGIVFTNLNTNPIY